MCNFSIPDRLEAAARAQEVAQQEASRLERSLVSEREQRLVLEAALKQIQEQMKLHGGALQEVSNDSFGNDCSRIMQYYYQVVLV